MGNTKNRSRLVGSTLAILLGGIFRAHAAPADALPEALTHLQSSTPGAGYLETHPVSVQGQEFTQALEAKTLRAGPWNYSVQLGATIPATLKNGTVMLVEFWLRTVASAAESGEAKTEVCVEEKGGTYEKLVLQEASAGQQWKKFDVPFRVNGPKGRDYAPGAVHLCFRLGYPPQTVQLAGVRLLDYGATADLQSLPMTHLDYAGRDLHAAWRLEAATRIRELRMAPLAVRVVDAQGQPVSGANVEMHETRGAFHFGSAVDMSYLVSTGADAKRYRQFVLDHFNQATPENDLKWDHWESNPGAHPAVLQALRLLHENGFRLHGHCLVWPGLQRMPPDIAGILHDRAALDRRIAAHCAELVGQTSGLINEWDVVNEPYSERDILKLYGEALVGDWFQLVHRLDPTPRLYLNEYANFQNGGDDSPHKRDFATRIDRLLQAGAPVQGLGMQSHFGSLVCPPVAVLQELDRFAKFKLPIEITEFDIESSDETLKADYTRDFLTACFSHPSVDAISCWGFWAGKHWKPESAMVRRDWTLTPWGKAWFDLVEKEWRTDFAAVSNPQGSVETRAFFGDYDVTVHLGDRTAQQETSFRAGAGPMIIKLP